MYVQPDKKDGIVIISIFENNRHKNMGDWLEYALIEFGKRFANSLKPKKKN